MSTSHSHLTGQIFYGILDLLAKPVFTIQHLYSLRNMCVSLCFPLMTPGSPYERFGFASGHASVGYGATAAGIAHNDGAARPVSTEKPAYAPHQGATEGAGSVANPTAPAA